MISHKPTKCFLLPVLVLISTSAAPQVLASETTVRDSVVKVLVTHRFPNLIKPWTKHASQKASGSGVIIDGPRILTNAHVVRFASQIYIQAFQSDEKVPATISAIAPGIDLAVLHVEDDSFYDHRPVLPLHKTLPKIKDTVNVYGYPLGGDELSITEGIVSRIEFTAYYNETTGLRIQVDAALNPGNSGGPAIVDRNVVGVVFSGIRQAENIGYLIPVEEIEIFLADVEDGQFDGKPQVFDLLQTVENSALRAKLGLSRDTGGAMVQKPYRKDDHYPLKTWDVITRIGKYDLDREGKVLIGDDLRLFFTYLIPQLAKDNAVPLTVWRDRALIDVSLPVKISRNVVIRHLKNEYPSYFIFGPLVFSPATQELVASLSRVTTQLSIRASPLIRRRADEIAFENEEIVVVASGMFPHPIIKGYKGAQLQVVNEVNGVKIKNLSHLIECLRDNREPFIALTFAGRGSETLIFRSSDMLAATDEILEDNGIRYQCSQNLRDVWVRQ